MTDDLDVRLHSAAPVPLSVCTWPGVSGESLLLQRQRDEGDGGQLLTELLQDDDSSQQGQVLHPVDTPTGEHR